MRNVDIIFDYINNKVNKEYIYSCIEKEILYGISANEIQENLNIVRNNASTILNVLWKAGKLVKINTRPVTFLPLSTLSEFLGGNTIVENTYTTNEINTIIINHVCKSNINDPFKALIGSCGTLLNQIEQAKAAIVYPKKGLHTLILGESGVGKTTFAYTMHEFGKVKKNLTDNDYPLISFNCSDYFNNPQFLLSQLFGHAKGTFTGADSDKIGLVEKANGGILFLDEIHRLPPDGQEMLFYLMDKGEYHRMGETGTKRKSEVLIIAATTESPSKTLLATFLRRIPVVITLPSFKDRFIGERIEIIQNLFSYESKNLNIKIKISNQVLKALSLYPFSIGNLGELRSEIKLLCAKAFLIKIASSELYIEFKMLNHQISEHILSFANSNINKSDSAYLEMFSEDLVISPSDELDVPQIDSKYDIYDTVMKAYEELKEQSASDETINDKIKSIIENNFNSLMKSLNTRNKDLNQLYKIVPKGITDYCATLIELCENELSHKYNSKFIYGFSLHINALLKRIRGNKPINNPDIIKIKNDYPREFDLSKKLVKLLSERYGLMVPEAEKGFLTILLANNKIDKKNEQKTKIFIICHGYSTATSLANVANKLLDSDLVKSIDMPLEDSISSTYDKFKSTTLNISKNSSILLMVDMGSLTEFGDRLMKETGIRVKTISNVSTLIVIEALRSVLYKNDDLAKVYEAITSKDYIISTQNENKTKAILTCCATGKGASMIAKNILSDMLASTYKDKISILTTNYTISEDEFNNLNGKYDIIAIVGSFKPKINLNVPYYSINRLLDKNFREEFLKFLEINMGPNSAQIIPNKNVYDIVKEMLEQYVRYVNPKFVIISVKRFIETLELDSIIESQDKIINFIIHLGCMLDRIIHGDFVKFDNLDEFKEKNIIQFKKVRNAISIFEEDFSIIINDDEVCYIISFINSYNRSSLVGLEM